jgi:hypothetical protein
MRSEDNRLEADYRPPAAIKGIGGAVLSDPLEENVAGIPPLNERVSYLNRRFVVGELFRLGRPGFCQYE